MIGPVLAGTTVRVVNIFTNFDGEPQDPQIVKFKVYDKKYALLTEVTLGEDNKIETGKYFYDYITPMEPKQKSILEFYGEISGNPTIERFQIDTIFVKA